MLAHPANLRNTGGRRRRNKGPAFFIHNRYGQLRPIRQNSHFRAIRRRRAVRTRDVQKELGSQKCFKIEPHEAVVRRYRRAATGTALLFCLLFSGLAAATGSVWTVTICAMLYVLLTLAEKLAYARALLHYKSVIVKLAKRIQELNHRKD